MKVLDWFLDLLFPRKCVLCGKLLDSCETDICRTCRVNAPRTPGSNRRLSYLADWTAVWYYEDHVRESILRYKFGGARCYADAYGRLLGMRVLQDFPGSFDLLTWVPVSKKRRRKRGYDQVELLACAVSRETGIRGERLLRKIRDNPPQSGIDDDARRRANVLGVYRAENPELVSGKRILLLDDVITTGATAGECARVLLTAGAKEVYCAAVASARGHTKKP